MWLLLAAAALAALFLYHALSVLTYWRRRGVPHATPLPIFGSFSSAFIGRAPFGAVVRRYIAPFKRHGSCGSFLFTKPLLLVWEPELAKQVLAKEFSSFRNRGMPTADAENDPLSAHLFNLAGSRWRRLRNKLSPVFTSGKLKFMLPIMRDVAGHLNEALRVDAVASGGDVDVQVLLTRFATDIIGTCAFGIDCNSLRTGDDKLLQMARETVRPTVWTTLRMFATLIHPNLAALFPMKRIFPAVTQFFHGLMKDTLEYREKNNVVRNDFVGLMMQLREADRAEPNPENRMEFTDCLMTAQAFIFFVAGLDHISNTLGFCIVQLAFEEELQQRAATEVRAVIREHDGQLTYEGLQKMHLLERIVKEALRAWNPVGFIFRKCNSRTTVGGVVVEEGEAVIVLAEVMHTDPELYPDPARFDPDRFTEEGKQSRHPYAFLPFGEGPRMCIADRFALLEMKLALASLLNEFVFVPCVRSERVPERDLRFDLPHPKNGFWVRALPRPS